MEGGKRATDRDSDEFDRLLEEIPNVDFGNPCVVETGPKNVLSGLPPVSVDGIMTGFSDGRSDGIRNSTRTTIGEDARALGDGNLLKKSANTDNGTQLGIDQRASNLPDDQSLASAFNELNLNIGIGNLAYSSLIDQTSPFCTSSFSPNIFSSANRSNCPFGFDSRQMPISPTETMFHGQHCLSNLVPEDHSPFMMTDKSNTLGSELDGQNNFFLSSNEPKRLLPKFIPGHNKQMCQRFPVFSHAMPVNSGLNSRFIPEVPRTDFDCPASTFWQGYYFDEQLHSHVPCQQRNQSTMLKCDLEDKRSYSMHSQYLYLQQHQNRVSEGHQLQKLWAAANGPLPGTEAHQYLELPFHYDSKQTHVDSYHNNHSSNTLYRQLDPSLRKSAPGRYNFKGLVEKRQSYTGLRDQKGSNYSNGYDDKYDMKSTNARCHSVDDISGRVLSLAKDQQGCRLLQEIFTEGTGGDVEKIFSEIIDGIVELMTDPFGNYLIQKLLDVCSENQRLQIVREITRPADELLRISCNQHGTRAVQKLIEKSGCAEEYSLITSALNPAIVLLMKDNNGNHVAQRCLQHLSPEYKEFLFHGAVENCVDLARDRQGCCVLQKCLIHLKGCQKLRLVSSIVSNALLLSQDPFGNYVVQFIIEHGNIPGVISKILDQFKGHYRTLSVLKSGSNVVEKCLTYAEDDRRVEIIHELTGDPHFLDIMQDQFGNYVVQTAIHKSKGGTRAILVEAIKPFIADLQSNPFGKKVLSCISKKDLYAGLFRKGHLDAPRNFPWCP